jgi:hypothetical protein
MVTIMYGGVTHHYVSPKLNYCNTINNYGTIHNQYTAVLVGDDSLKAGVLKGKDSVCADILGLIGTAQIKKNIDFVAGGYNTNFDEFRVRNIEPPSVLGVTPVLGVNFKMPIYQSQKYKVELNNLVSLGIITHSVSVSF